MVQGMSPEELQIEIDRVSQRILNNNVNLRKASSETLRQRIRITIGEDSKTLNELRDKQRSAIPPS
ncbi:MAG: hypothetical protein JWN50_323 [Parcubacteria group bacterium]|nr:hypothetical protein [Parcubacteria group bacterium]